jgi:hypothetical protein
MTILSSVKSRLTAIWAALQSGSCGSKSVSQSINNKARLLIKYFGERS